MTQSTSAAEIERALRALEEAASLVDQVSRGKQRDPAWDRLHDAVADARKVLGLEPHPAPPPRPPTPEGPAHMPWHR